MGRDRRTSLAGKVTRFLQLSHQQDNLEFVYTTPSDTSVGDIDVVDFEFLDYGEMELGQSSSSSDDHQYQMDFNDYEDDEEEKKDPSDSVEENRSFWDNQHQLLQANICRSSSLESRIRNATKEAVHEIKNSAENVCGCTCSRQMGATTCRNCLRREVSRRLQKAGFNSAICKTIWRSSQNIPSGEHTFLDVIDNTSTKKGEVRVMIELNFRAEFEMARGSNEYNQLVQKLPEIFVGKVERLSNIIKILCMAAKKCMKEKRMHMGPWRKHRYMQAKWLGPCERNTSTTPLSMGYSERLIKPKPKASMLTIDLLDKLPNMHYNTAVEVV